MCTGGIASTAGGCAISYTAASHTFNGTVIIGSLTVAMTDLIPSLMGYATLAAPQLTGKTMLNGLSILTRDVTFLPAYTSVGRFIELGCSLANIFTLEF